MYGLIGLMIVPHGLEPMGMAFCDEGMMFVRYTGGYPFT